MNERFDITIEFAAAGRTARVPLDKSATIGEVKEFLEVSASVVASRWAFGHFSCIVLSRKSL